MLRLRRPCSMREVSVRCRLGLEGKELILDHHYPRACPKDQSGVTWPLAGGRRQDHFCGRAWWLCNTSWVFCCFALGNTSVHPCRLFCIPTAISRDTDCMYRCSHGDHCFSLLLFPIAFPYQFCDQKSGLNTCIHLFSIHEAIKLSFHYRGTWPRICFSKKSVKFLWENKCKLFWLDWCYYRVDPPK